MSAGIGTPVNQVRLTNVAYVRLQKKGKRFEIACYRNKVLSWRNKVETDLGEVLQIDTVFTHVSKGNLASSKDLMDAFGTSDQKAVCREILDKGELQVSEQERGALVESMFRDVAAIVVDKAVNPENNRPYTISMIQNAMKQLHFSVNTSKSAKSQALDVIRKLKEVMPIARACMLLRVTCPASYIPIVQDILSREALATILEEREISDGGGGGGGAVGSSALDTVFQAPAANLRKQFDVRIDPEAFRLLSKIPELTDGQGLVEVLQLRAAVGGDHKGAAAGKTEASAAASTTTTTIAGAAASANVENAKKPEAPRGGEDDDEEEEEEEVLGIVKRGRKQKQKNKNKGFATMLPASSVAMPLTSVEEDESGDSDEEAEDDEETEAESLALSLAASRITTSKASVQAKPEQKKGKKSKRLEKELRTEQESKLQAVKNRMEQDAARQAAAATAAAAVAAATPDASVSACAAPVGAGAGKAQTCTTCKAPFSDPAAYRNHFKSEWHRYNLKQKMQNLPPIATEDEFERNISSLAL